MRIIKDIFGIVIYTVQIDGFNPISELSANNILIFTINWYPYSYIPPLK